MTSRARYSLRSALGFEGCAVYVAANADDLHHHASRSRQAGTDVRPAPARRAWLSQLAGKLGNRSMQSAFKAPGCGRRRARRDRHARGGSTRTPDNAAVVRRLLRIAPLRLALARNHEPVALQAAAPDRVLRRSVHLQTTEEARASSGSSACLHTPGRLRPLAGLPSRKEQAKGRRRPRKLRTRRAGRTEATSVASISPSGRGSGARHGNRIKGAPIPVTVLFAGGVQRTSSMSSKAQVCGVIQSRAPRAGPGRKSPAREELDDARGGPPGTSRGRPRR